MTVERWILRRSEPEAEVDSFLIVSGPRPERGQSIEVVRAAELERVRVVADEKIAKAERETLEWAKEAGDQRRRAEFLDRERKRAAEHAEGL